MGLNKNKPNRRSRYRQGYVDPATCPKHIAKDPNEPIIYRSGLELRFIQFCEQSSQIRGWASEPLEIPYYNELDRKMHTYYPDYVVISDTGQRAVVEIKPENQTVKPTEYASEYSKQEWIRNCAKWKYAMEWCRQNDYKFMIVTENFFNKRVK